MLSRRPIARHNRGRIPAGGAASAPVTPATIFGGDLLIWLRGDSIVTGGGGTTVTQFTDLSGNGHHFAGGVAPIYNAALIDGQPGAMFDGLTHFLQNTSHVYVAPGTTPTFHGFMVRQISWGASRPLISSVTGFVQEIFCNTSTPQMRCFNAASGPLNNGLTIGQAKRVNALFSNSTNDFLRCGSVNSTGTNTGNGAGGGGSRLAHDGGSNFFNVDFCEYIRVRISPSAPQLAAWDAYLLARYPTSGF